MPPKRAKPKTKKKQRGRGSKLMEFLPEFGKAILQENKSLSLIANEIQKNPDILIKVYEADKAKRAGRPKTFEVHPLLGMVGMEMNDKAKKATAGTEMNDKVKIAMDYLKEGDNAKNLAKNLGVLGADVKKTWNGYLGYRTPQYLPSYGVLY